MKKKEDTMFVTITKNQYNYLIGVPCLRKHFHVTRQTGQDIFQFFGSQTEIKDMYRRLAYFD